MGKKKEKAAGGSDIPEWLVTFADLMSILVCFFVLIISFSIQDDEKLQVVAGSMKDAFGVIKTEAKAGIIERDGNPQRDFVKSVTTEESTNQTEFAEIKHNERSKQGPEANTHDIEKSDVETPREFALATTTLRQAWQELPDITFVADNLLIEETEEGLHIQIVDQEGRTMFPEGSKYPYEVTRQAIAIMTPILKSLPNQIRVTGHTAAGASYHTASYGPWELSSDRANVVRRLMEEFGMPSERIFSVVGKGDADPLFPNDPYLSANRRISILVMQESPPVPIELKP
ncbi:flagellar motor protein MotB [Maritalea porphyrae]|jgi:chemotaxis protein MotB|uniref:OmpA/MotB family protein n=1 Tax=Maritalea porphyrae TaxID=880732 RepID=UPI0022AFDC8E|nr:flagellar motor protein MotB [Maritalea porphyrae]MCZ4273783.1 flagellar motor protein MotB [Maritalea porphyrae]